MRIGTELRERAPELDTQALRRGLNDFSVSTQQRVSTKLSELDASTRQTIADSRLEEPVVRYLSETRDGGTRYLNRLDDDDIRATFGCRRGGSVSATQTLAAGAGGSSIAAAGTAAGPCDVDLDADINKELTHFEERGDITPDQADELVGDVRRLAEEEGIDVSGLLTRNDGMSRAIVAKYVRSDALDTDSLRLMNEYESDVEDLVDNVGLSYEDGGELLLGYAKHAKDFDPSVPADQRQIRQVSEVQNDLEQLADANVKNIDDTITSSTPKAFDGGDPNTRDIGNLKGLDGEVRAGQNLLENPDFELDSMNRIIRDDGDQLTEIDIDLSDETIIESKNFDLDVDSSSPPDQFRYDDIRDKFEKFETTNSRKDEFEPDRIIVAGKGSPSDDLLELARTWESRLDWDVEIEYRDYSELKDIQ